MLILILLSVGLAQAELPEGFSTWDLSIKKDPIEETTTIRLTLHGEALVYVKGQRYGREYDHFGAISFSCHLSRYASTVEMGVLTHKSFIYGVEEGDAVEPAFMIMRYDSKTPKKIFGWKTTRVKGRDLLLPPEGFMNAFVDTLRKGGHYELLLRSESPFTGKRWTMKFNVTHSRRNVMNFLRKCKAHRRDDHGYNY